MTFSELILVATGGALGAVSRFSFYWLFNSLSAHIPAGQIVANLLGSFLAGLCFTFLDRWDAQVKSLVIIGFLGSFTTMSAFAFDVVALVREKHFLEAGTLWVSGAGLSILFAFGGMVISSKFFS